MEFLKLDIQFFAVSAEATNSSLVSDAGNKATIYVKFTENSLSDTNITNNTSTIQLTGTYTQNTGSWSQISSPMFYLEWYDDKRQTWTEVAKKNVTAMNRYDVVTLSGTISPQHKDDGTLNGKARVRWTYTAGSTLVPRSDNATTASKALTQVPRETKFASVTSANIEENPTIKLTKQNPNATTTITWSCSGNGVNRSGTVKDKTSATSITDWTIPTDVYSCISSTGKSATINLTATTYNGTTPLTKTASTPFTATISKERNKPNVSSFSAKDINTATTDLTGNENVVVLNASTIRCTYSATAKNGAYIKSANINNVALTSGSTTISGTKDFVKPTTNTFTLSATDSRDFPNTAIPTNTISKIDYFVPTLNATIERNTPTDGKVNISFNGKFFNNTFGAKHNKDYFKVEYRYAEKGASLPGWTPLTPTPSGNNFSGSLSMDGFDYQKAYTVQIRLSDAINTITKSQDISVGRPSPWWDKENMYVDGEYYKRNKTTGKLENIKSVIYPVGSIYSSSSNTHPQTLFGGEWTQIGTYRGGDLIGVGTVMAQNGTKCEKGVDVPFSDTKIGTKSQMIYSFVPDVITFDSGTIKIRPQGIVGLVEAVYNLSGLGESGLTGLWFKGNSNAISQAIGMKGNGFMGTGPYSASYGGTSNIYYYFVGAGVTENFYVNPLFSPYGGNFTPSISGLLSWIKVKVYARAGTTYVWKRTA